MPLEHVPTVIPEVARVVILTAGRGVSPGMEIQLQAVGLNARGQIVATDGFQWQSDTALLDHQGNGLFVVTPGTGNAAVTATFSGAESPLSLSLLLSSCYPAHRLAYRLCGLDPSDSL